MVIHVNYNKNKIKNSCSDGAIIINLSQPIPNEQKPNGFSESKLCLNFCPKRWLN